MTQLEHLIVKVSAETVGLDRGLIATAKGVNGLSASAAGGTLNVNRLSGGLLALASQATGANPAVARLANVLGAFAVGGPVMLGVLAGVAAVGLAWRLYTKDAREAREATEELIDGLVKAGQSRRAQTVPGLQKTARAAETELARLMVDRGEAQLREVTMGAEWGPAARKAELAVTEAMEAVYESARNLEAGMVKAQTIEGISTRTADQIRTAGAVIAAAALEAAERLQATAARQAAVLAGGTIIGDSDAFSAGRQARLVARIAADRAAVMGPNSFAGGIRIPGSITTRTTVDRPGTGDAGTDFMGKLKSMASAIGGVLSALNPWKFLLEAVQRAIGDFIVSIIPIVEILATALMPILKALFPVFKMVAIAGTYLSQVVFNVSGWIVKAIGGLLVGIGEFINWLLPGNPANGLVKAGKALEGLGTGFMEAAGEMHHAREEIKGLEWQDALDPLTEAAQETASALRNVPAGLKVAFLRYQASPAGMQPGGVPGGVSSAPGSSGNPIETFTIAGDLVVQGVQDVPALVQAVEREVRGRFLRGAAAPLSPAF